MKLSEFIKKYGDYEVTDKIKECVTKNPKTVWDLKIGDRYCYITTLNTIRNEVWTNSYQEREMRKVGRILLTNEDAVFQIEKMKVYEELKRFAKDFTDKEWEDGQIKKYCIYFNFYRNNIGIDAVLSYKYSILYFESYEKVQEAITAVGEERVKKYYLGIWK